MTKFISVDGNICDNGIYHFEKEIVIEKEESYKINIFASTRYILYINDEYICEGPCRGKQEVKYYDTIETNKFIKGINHIKVVVMHTNIKAQFATVFKNDKPMLIFEASSKSNTFSSDTSWSCSYIKGHKLFRAEGYFDSIPPSEAIDMSAPSESMETVEVGYYGYDFTKEYIAPWGGIGLYSLAQRPIPMIYPDKAVEFKIVKQGENFVELDAGEYVTAKVSLTIAKQSSVKIIYSECYTFSDGAKKRKRDDSSGELHGMHDTVKTDKDEFTFETYWFKAFRFIRIETENPKAVIKKITAKRVNYPLNITSDFKCSDEYYNQMYKTSINTMLCCMHEIFVDCPHYEQQQYQMDTAVEANVSMRMSNDVRLIKKCIDDLAGSQISSGLLMANYPNTATQILTGFSFFLIFLLKDYLDYTKDSEFVYKYLGVMDKILNYFDNEIRKQGYISRSCYWDYVDWVEEWEEGVPDVEQGDILTVYNMYYLCALKDAAYICTKLNKNHYAAEYSERYEALKQTVNSLCFDGELYTDGHKNKKHSVHTIVWAVLSEIVSGDTAKKMMKHIYDNDISKVSFSMMFYLFRAFEKCGMYDMLPGMLEGWKQMIDLNCTTWCETYPEITRSECHAWSSAPLYEFMSNVLGVRCGFDDEIIIAPKTLGLSFAEGSVPTRYGNVDVKWETVDGEFKIKITAPENVKKVLIIPDGKTECFYERKYSKLIG